jgi:flagellar L-ring protein precursor FlgH
MNWFFEYGVSRPLGMRMVASLKATCFVIASVLGACILAGCETLPQTAKVDFADPKPSAIPTIKSELSNGSLFSTATYRPSLEDRRARLVGDVVTIQIVEAVSASQVSTSTAARTSSNSGSVTGVPLLAMRNAADNVSGLTASSALDFSGKGGTTSANTFTGTITATVSEVLPNGHLIVVGEKQIGVNQNVDVLRFTGTVDPRTMLPGSIVSSSLVSNVRVESKGRGAQNDVQTVGWFSRFFSSVWPF